MDPILERILETVRRESAKRPDEHVSDDLNGLVDVVSRAIHQRNFDEALRALEAIREVAVDLRRVVPSSGQLIQKTIQRIEERKYVHRLEVIAFANMGDLQNDLELIEQRNQLADDMDEFIREAVKLSIANLDPQQVS